LVTIALTLNVHAGVVLGADSATTFPGRDGRPAKVYYHASKLFRLHQRVPIGAVTWGMGSVGDYSIEVLARSLRRRLEDPADSFYLSESAYSVEAVARQLREAIFEDVYEPRYRRRSRSRSPLGFVVAGYSSDGDLPEEWIVLVDERGQCSAPKRLRAAGETGLRAFGQYDAVNRLVRGMSDYFEPLAEYVGIGKRKAQRLRGAFDDVADMRPIRPHMPIRDAIELAQFLVGTEIGFHRFSGAEPAPTVGGTMEIAAITRTHGFQWVSHANPYRAPRRVNDNETEPDLGSVRAVPRER
jgi:hypothetical protein